MKALIILFILQLLSTLVVSQSFFSKILDLGGDDMEGRLYNVIPLEDEIKIIGDLHDSIVPGFDGGIWPVLGTVSYSGEYLGTDFLIDSAYSDGFIYFTRRLAFKNDSICFLYDRRDLGAPFLDAYLIELNYRTGEIVRSKVIYDQISANGTFLATDIGIGNSGKIYLMNVSVEWGPHPQVLTVLDSNMTVLTQRVIPDHGRTNITKFMEEDPAGNLVLIGVSLGQPTPIWFESKLFYQLLDSNYNPIEYKLAPTAYDQTIVSYEFYPVIKSKSNEWVFGSQVLKPTSDCQGCFILIPYIVRVSADFSEVISETRLFDGDKNSSVPEYLVRSITEVNDGYILAGATDGMFGIETSGFLGKVSLDGDSLWLKHYLPVEWDSTQARWFHWQDIKTTPTGNIVVGSYGSDRFASKIVPWILHLDKDGCLEPNCNITSVFDEKHDQQVNLNVFPNPVRDKLNIQIQLDNSQSLIYKLRILNYCGVNILEVPINRNDTTVVLDIQRLSAGNYYLLLLDEHNNSFAKKIIVIN